MNYTEIDENVDGVVDEAEKDKSHTPFQYDINSFGADYDVEGLVKRLNRGDIFIPHFQRDYVWNMSDASKFIESLLLGLPVPGVFLAKEPQSNKLIVIDGQQRLKSLQFFYNGYFNPKHETRQRVFKLSNVEKPFDGKTFEALDENDRITLNDSIIHSTIIKQVKPEENDDSSVYLVFERLNAGGRKLVPQEIRAAVSYGDFLKYIEQINDNSNWRVIFGKYSPRLKDRELILRFFSFINKWQEYKRPFKDFLNSFLSKNRNPSKEFLKKNGELFQKCISTIYESIGSKAFRPEGTLNAAVFDSVMVGLATRIKTGKPIDKSKFITEYENLLKDNDYIYSISKSTSTENSVKTRINFAINFFGRV